MKKALVVGVDHYPTAPLAGCVNDAEAIATLLEKNGDGSPNFSIRLLTSDKDQITSAVLNDTIGELFKGDADTALLFFAGHGIINPVTNAGYLVSQDGKKGAWGISLADILGLANAAAPRIKSSVIILDSCHSGYAGEVQGIGNQSIAAIGEGVTILTACHREQTASELNGHGLFSSIVLDALSGGSADVCGRITPASVYSHVDQTLGPWEQRPIYKANVQTFVTLREVSPKVSMDVLRRLPQYFPDAAYVFPLDPSFEPDRSNFTDEMKNKFPVNPTNQAVLAELQQCYRHGLVTPVGTSHMYYAAMESKACRLSALGAHYRKLAAMGRI
ncbi:caspase family protein [Bradyrhizobium japonicum]|uniref:caspase family protein n=1 Tax=Bradyrhizobium japonicum TaxID=375 RepID=UPI001BAB37AC|nr:caspase family protein [Bradyrhizobium japonicum]MBR0804126.1 caspase family protein [Bradyrhizobium japonicum]